MPESTRIQVINGPNLNMLGKREPGIYGAHTLEQINQELSQKASGMGVSIDFFQSNHEGRIIDKVHELFEQKISGIIINPGAFTHTSVALRDAMLLMSCPIVEIHLSNIYKREPFRHKSMLADIATGQISGFGHFGYQLALEAVCNAIQSA